MGYRVGSQCLSDNEKAHDYVLSQLPPTITNEGQLIRPVKEGSDWYLSGNKISLSFPECDYVDQIQLGAYLAVSVILLFGLVFFFRLVKKMINDMGKIGLTDDS